VIRICTALDRLGHFGKDVIGALLSQWAKKYFCSLYRPNSIVAIFVGDDRWAASIRDVVTAGDAEAACSFCVRRFKGDLQKESFKEIALFPRTEISEGPTTAQPQEKASTPDIRKLSYRDENKKILDSCMWRASWFGAVEDKKVIR
jgi:hypothetical protein